MRRYLIQVVWVGNDQDRTLFDLVDAETPEAACRTFYDDCKQQYGELA